MTGTLTYGPFKPVFRATPTKPSRFEEMSWAASHETPAAALVSVVSVTAPGELNWPQPSVDWIELLGPLQTPVLATDELVFSLEVTEVDGSQPLQFWEQRANEFRTITYTAVDAVAELIDLPDRGRVRLGASTMLPGRYRFHVGEYLGHPVSVRIPLDAFRATDPGLGLFPAQTGLDLLAVTPDAAVRLDRVEVQRS